MPVETIDRLAGLLDAEAARVSAEVDDFFARLLPPTDDGRERHCQQRGAGERRRSQ
jgi:farnesyl diphosphate synthase